MFEASSVDSVIAVGVGTRYLPDAKEILSRCTNLGDIHEQTRETRQEGSEVHVIIQGEGH